MVSRYYNFDFSPWWLLVAPAMWAILLLLAFGPSPMKSHHEPGVRHSVGVLMDLPICRQLDAIPDGFCEVTP